MGSVNEVFWTLADKADKKFARLRDLPPYGGNKWDVYFNKAFQVYTKLWKFQQENRQALVDAGLKRWEIGEIASRIGQLYYNYYMRTSDAAFLSESYIFYEAIMSREYFKDTGKDVTLANKNLRFYARFIVVCLLLNRRETAIQLTRQLRTLVDDYRRTFQGNDSKEWKRVIQDITRFLKADAPCQNSRPLRYSVLLDPLPNAFPPISSLSGSKPLTLKDSILVSYHHNEVKFSELTLDTFRFLQCLEWEPSGSLYRLRVGESNGTTPGHSGPMRGDEIMDQSLPRNPHKYILHRPSILQLLLVIATACEELPADSIILLHLSASGRKPQSQMAAASFSTMTASVSTSSGIDSGALFTANHSEGGSEVFTELIEPSPSSSPDHVSAMPCETTSLDPSSSDAGLWFGSRGSAGISYLYPADLLPFTRRPLFIIIDSDKSACFEVIHGEERGEPAALLLSPMMQPDGERGDSQERGPGSFFTFFLTAPFLAFCQLVNISVSTLTQGVVDQLQKLLTCLMGEWGKTLSATALNLVWVRVMWDPFLRQLLLRFIFCRACLALHKDYGDKREHSPHCLPALPKELLPTAEAVEGVVFQLASQLGVVNQFNFAPMTPQIEITMELQKL